MRKGLRVRARHIAVDTSGLLLAVLVTSASAQDRDAARPLLWALRVCFPTITLTWADSGYAGKLIDWAATQLGLTVQIVAKLADQIGFVVLHRRWAVERTFSWINRSRRTVRDYERLPAHHAAMIQWAMVIIMTRRLARHHHTKPASTRFLPGSQTSVILVLVVVTALVFDFTNGFHDTANAMATSIATHALRQKAAVALSGLLNLVGAFLSVQVALTVTNAVVKIQNANGTPRETLTAGGGQALLLIVLAGLVGGIVWNLLTWLLGLPSSSSHALFGGLIGATIAGLGWAGVNWNGNGSKLDGVVGKGLAAESASAAVILASSHPAFALSTTHVATGSILGSGVGRPGATVRWRIAGRMVIAWLITLPAAAVVGALMWYLGSAVGGLGGALVDFGLLLALAGIVYRRSRRAPVSHHNVNEDWVDMPDPERVPAGAAS